MSSNIPTWVPPSASHRAAAMWRESPFNRFYDLVRLTDRKADEYARLLFESFSADELRLAVARMYDIRPLVREKSMIDAPIVGPLARAVIRTHWLKLEPRLKNPGYILALVRQSDPEKFAILDAPMGRRWLNWTCYELLGLLAYYCRPKGWRGMDPPPGPNPLAPLPQPALPPPSR